MPKISICMMVKDEEKNIKRCLDSIKGLLDNDFAELIIVDTGSNDNTINIVNEYTKKIYFHKWEKDFSKMRNITISYASGEWIFIIDADEEVENIYEITSIFNSKKIEKYNTIAVEVKNLSEINSKNIYMVNMSPRFFKNKKGFKYVGAVHNQPVFENPIFYSKIKIFHYGYITQDKALMEKKYKRTTEILFNELKKDPDNIYYRYQLAVSFSMYNNKIRAFEEFRKAYCLLNNKTAEEKKLYMSIYSSYAREAWRNEKYNVVIESCKEGLKINHDFIDLYYLLGIAYIKMGLKEEALAALLKYTELILKIDNLKIVKDMSIPLYHIDKNSQDIVYIEISKLYLEKDYFFEAYKYAQNIDSQKDKIIMTISILLKEKNYNKIKEVYLELSDDIKNTYEAVLENNIKELDDEEIKVIRNEFCNIDNNYGLYNHFIINKNVDAIYSFLKLLNFDEIPLFYMKLFEMLKDNIKEIICLIKKLNTDIQKNIILELTDKYDFSNYFKNYILMLDINKIRDLEEITTLKIICNILLVNLINNILNVTDEYEELFKKYTKIGIEYITKIYQKDKFRLIYKNIENNEDKFIILFYLSDEYLNKSDVKLAIKYLKEAVKSYPKYSKFIQKKLQQIEI
ncbi:Glycosyl transferase family 2 [Caloramator quimbayensis]|uniref:Glycosyl transferase family 2 n=1 Tax=Caloramator quimbayensis TaxID=1147123 RepID=A0A1T4XAU0_9CLOT|nr:glycosyltransferase family 2 protein [Caloramator quimbayensis]SKA86228.1 Glycosyl transferase family 2 [Caloramator quimbayensis]